jgi:hypothetical protein
MVAKLSPGFLRLRFRPSRLIHPSTLGPGVDKRRILDKLENLAAAIGAFDDSLERGLDSQALDWGQRFDYLLEVNQFAWRVVHNIFGRLCCVTHVGAPQGSDWVLFAVNLVGESELKEKQFACRPSLGRVIALALNPC